MSEPAEPEKPARPKARPSAGARRDDIRETPALTPEMLAAIGKFLKPLIVPEKPPKEWPEEVASRLKLAEEKSGHDLKEEAADNAHRRSIEGKVYLLVMGGGILAAVLAIFPGIPDTARSLAIGVMASMVTGGFGFLAGKNSKG